MLAWLPPVGGLPLFGYAAMRPCLFGAVLLVPALMRRVDGIATAQRRVVLDTAVAQLQGTSAFPP